MISAVILTKNEEENIVDCLETLLWCDEIIVIDDYSEDRTVEVIQSASWRTKLKIFKRGLNGDFSAQRNFGLSKAKGEWVLFVDADERVSEALASEISNIKYQISNISGFYIKRTDFMWGRELKHGETGNIKLLRLAKKDVGEWQGKVHEEWKIKGEVGELKNPLLHYPHQDIATFLKEINRYTDLRAKELFDRGEKVGFLKIILYPLLKFKINYFLKLGFLDEVEGLVFAIMMSFHSFLVRAKLWTYLNKN